jgi:hypothetical protein
MSEEDSEFFRKSRNSVNPRYQTDLAPHINRIREQQIEMMLHEK